jgi:outer membrane biosynthesis protein TonB
MARRRNLPRNPHLQVGPRLTSLFLIAALAFAGPSAQAASKSPTPKAKVSTKATAKTTAKPAATKKATAKPAATKKATAKPKPKPTKKKVVKKKKKRAKVRVTPSPKPVWPPKGFSVEGEVYAKIPTAKELVGLISANKTLEKRIKSCTTYICGSVQVASEIGCIWWEVISEVSDGQGTKLGDLTSAFASSGPKEFKTIIIVSPESTDNGGAAKIVSVICHHEDRNSLDPSNTYKKA